MGVPAGRSRVRGFSAGVPLPTGVIVTVADVADPGARSRSTVPASPADAVTTWTPGITSDVDAWASGAA